MITRTRRRAVVGALVSAALAGGLLFAPMAKAHEPRQFDPTLAANQDTEDGYYDCQSWWYQDEGTKVWHVNTFSHEGETFTHEWSTDSSDEVWEGQGSGSC